MLEVIALRADDALRARDYGAQRIELVSAIESGGLTPDARVVDYIVRTSGLPVMVMVRPHARSFVYDRHDMSHVRHAIAMARGQGAHGVVFGSLDAHGAIDTAQLEQVLEWAHGLSMTFHRAFDETSDLLAAYRTLGNYGGRVSRVLTSGGAIDAPAGAQMLTALLRQYNGVEILVGAGVTAGTIGSLQALTGAREFHSGSGARERNRYDYPLSREAISAMSATAS